VTGSRKLKKMMNAGRVVGCVAALLVSASGFVIGAGSDVADAVMKGDKAAVRALLRTKADVNAPQIDGATALHRAVYRDDLETADLLIRAGATVGATNREGVTPLSMAALYGNTAMITRLLKAGADPKQRGPNGETTLMLAARNGDPEAVRVLIAAGAEPNARETLRGTTALMWAAEQKHPAAVRALLDGGADFRLRSGGAGLPRNYMAPTVKVANVQAAAKRYADAAAAGRTYEEQLALEGKTGRFGGAAVASGFSTPATTPAQTQPAQTQPAQTQPAQTPPAQTQPAQTPPAGQGGRGQGAGRAGQNGRGAAPAGGQPTPQQAPDPDDDDNTEVVVAGLVGSGGGGLTALVFAAREGDLESAQILLEAGADVNQTTEYGWTPLLTATNNRHYKLGRLLMDWGADVNRANKGGWSPLYIATDNRNIEGGDYPVPKPDMDSLEYIRLLLDYGANPNARVRDNTLTRTIFTMQWLFENGATAFVRAAQSSDMDLLKLLLTYGADPKIATVHNDTALTVAAGIGWVEGVTYEWSKQANFDVIKMLLDLGLDPNGANNDGRTPLMGAAMKGRNDVVQLLVDRGAKLDTRDNGSRDTDTTVSQLAGHTWQALDYADGLVRVGVQSAVNRPETAALIRKLMTERGLTVPPANRTVESICIVEICRERTWK
jgi:ankyrin repeat protein